MKTYLYQSLIFMSLCSCSTDTPEVTAGAWEQNAARFAYKSGNSPANPANPYDSTGILVDALLDDYHLLPEGKRSLAQVIELTESLGTAHEEFQALLPDNYQAPEAGIVAQILDNPNPDFTVGTDYSAKGKEHLRSIALELQILKLADAPYHDVLDYFIEIEGEILADNLSEQEKEALLITASALRYALYNDTKKPKRDRDWEWSTANVAATSSGSIENIPDAILLCVVSKVYEP